MWRQAHGHHSGRAEAAPVASADPDSGADSRLGFRLGFRRPLARSAAARTSTAGCLGAILLFDGDTLDNILIFSRGFA